MVAESLLSPLCPQSLNLSVTCRLWGDYFNNALKCWEPLLEPFSCRVLFEKSAIRGLGLTLKAYCPLQVSIAHRC